MSKQKRYSKITKEIIKIIGVFGICCCINGCGSTKADEVFSVIKPVVNSSNEPVGVSTDRLDFGWQMESSERGKKQSAYRITVAASEKDLKKNIYVWDSGKVESSDSVYIPYEGENWDITSDDQIVNRTNCDSNATNVKNNRKSQIIFSDGGFITRNSEDKYILIAEIREEFPGRNIIEIIEILS